VKNISFTPQAYKDYLEWLKIDRKIFLKVTTLIRETARNPKEGTGNPEPLKHNLEGYWSRRINQKHRLVYKITDDSIVIVACKYHYSK